MFGEFHHLYRELRDSENLFNAYTRMSTTTFDYIVESIKPELNLKSTNFRDPISVEERLLVTLRYLATGLAFRQLALTFRISKSGVVKMVIEVCKAIWSDEFYEKWNFPNCVGSIDGKHIRLRCPKNSGIVDAKYRFIMINVGGCGKNSDGGILCDTNFHQRLESGTLKLPIERKLGNSGISAPYVFVGDEAFPLRNPLRNYLMRPFPRNQAQETNK
ncbi:uncharacterized protein LOC132943589 [Metopolophium dirhodum]|uniref:uncharacterized protein LOC132943589 n=1 Tax=Metopolophium dirhodum TaxID=44670 RepID=UPI0029906A48|nr:uncharacterized protein LOC132943589 [Metopolophium dirhodum]